MPTYRCSGDMPAAHVECEFTTDSLAEATAHFERTSHSVDEDPEVTTPQSAPTPVTSYKVGIITAPGERWSYNALRFRTEADARAYGIALAIRWTMVRAYEVHPSDEAPNR